MAPTSKTITIILVAKALAMACTLLYLQRAPAGKGHLRRLQDVGETGTATSADPSKDRSDAGMQDESPSPSDAEDMDGERMGEVPLQQDQDDSPVPEEDGTMEQQNVEGEDPIQQDQEDSPPEEDGTIELQNVDAQGAERLEGEDPMQQDQEDGPSAEEDGNVEQRDVDAQGAERLGGENPMQQDQEDSPSAEEGGNVEQQDVDAQGGYEDSFCRGKFFSGGYCLGSKYVKCSGRRAVHVEYCPYHQPCREYGRRTASCGAGDGFCKDKFFSGSFCDGKEDIVVCKGQRVQKKLRCPYHDCQQNGSSVRTEASCGAGDYFCKKRFFDGSFCSNNGVVVCKNRRVESKHKCPYHAQCREEGSKLRRYATCKYY